MKKSILFLALLFISSIAFSQVTIIYYDLEYNETTDLFDCNMVVEGETATSAAERLQYGAQFSIVVATGTTVTLEESYLPIYNNETYTGTVPMNWSIENIEVDPPELPGFDIIGIVPDLSGPPAHYNNLSCCDPVTLFSLSAVGDNICSLSLRIFDNNNDPTSFPSGYNFTNSMMIGGTDEDYTGNKINFNTWEEVDITIPGGEICEGECFTLVPTFNCIFPGMEYQWSTGETTETITVCPTYSQNYYMNLSGTVFGGYEIEVPVFVDEGINTGEQTDLCVGVPVNYFPETGIWWSSDESIVTVDNDGVVTPLSGGTAIISHTNDLGNCLDEVIVTVQTLDFPTFIGDDIICAGKTSQLYPSVGVTWSSEDNQVATIDDTGLITGVGWGSTVFTYTTEAGCVSEPSLPVSVLVIPEPEISGLDSICAFETTKLTPGAGVTWVSTDTSVARVENDGTVTGVSEGTSRFYFTDMATGCTSDESDPVSVLSSPLIQLSADTVCQGESVFATANVEGGFWTITLYDVFFNSPTIDSVTGEINSTESGTLGVHYTSENGCLSEVRDLTFLSNPIIESSSNSPICVGENITLHASPPAPGEGYSYLWSGPNGFSSIHRVIVIPDAQLNMTGQYSVVATEEIYGCVSEEVFVDVVVEDCNPCEEEWIKVPVSAADFPSVGDFEIAASIKSGNTLEDFIYYNESEKDIRLVKNNGERFFEDEITLFELPYISDLVDIDIVDIDQDGLKDIVTFQKYQTPGSIPADDTLTITVFKNLDNYSFENSLEAVLSGSFNTWHATLYRDMDNQGFLDIIPYWGPIIFTDNWQAVKVPLPEISSSVFVEDFNEDGLLDVLGNESFLFINNGDRSFFTTTIGGDLIYKRGLYDSNTGVYINDNNVYQIKTGEDSLITVCLSQPNYTAHSFFYANISSNTKLDGVIESTQGFRVYETPMTCQNTFYFKKYNDFRPRSADRIDLTGNGFTDFITTDGSTIYAWINPNEQPKIRGTAFIDNNGDGMLNENDSPLRNVMISIEPGNLSVLTADDGSYQLIVPEGMYTLTANVNDGDWINDELVIENIEITEPCNLGFDFGFEPDPNAEPDVNLSMVNTITRCDFETKFTITVENTGTDPFESQLQFEFDDKTSFFSTEIIGAIVAGNKVTANIGPLEPFQPQEYIVRVKMPAGSSVLPILDFKASLLDEGEEVIKEYGYSEQLRCSYDPNDKRAFPDREGDENLTLMGEAIEYTIRFQNNGNDTAYNVKIIDQLDSNIDPSSIRVVGSSHSVETCIEGTDLIFLFEDINLVDSMTNYALSQGYVTFKCNAREGLAEFTPVDNTADIIFDTNLPIVTNQTLNTMVSELCTDKSTVIDKYICDGETYLGYSETGSYTESYVLPYGCDSLVTINLEVQGITISQQAVNVCETGIIKLGAEEYFIDESTFIIDTVYTDQGCISHINNYDITLVPDLIDIEGGFNFCVNSIASIFPVLDGVWSSDNPSVLEITSDGNMTAVGPGEAILQYIDNSTGCFDEVQVIVYPNPILFNEGSDQICINEANQLTSDTEGSWISSDTLIATITINGLVIGKAAGSVVFTFTGSTSLCSESIEMEVLPATDSKCIVSTNDGSIEPVIIYPNPTDGFVYIESKEAWQSIKLINTDGKVFVSNQFGAYQTKKRLDLGDIPSGVYFLFVERANGVTMKKVVVY